MLLYEKSNIAICDGNVKSRTPSSPQLESIKTLKVADILTEKVVFENADMYKILAKMEDNSNTILMCRNILGYFDENKIEEFIKMVGQKLKKDSLFLIGEHDTRISFIERYLGENGFTKVMKHVFKKI